MRYLVPFALGSLILFGCAAPSPKVENKPATPEAQAAASNVSCEQCGKVVARTEAVEHGSSMICQACEATHNH
jgi:formylmethanofuran dehydrogenase subunit E